MTTFFSQSQSTESQQIGKESDESGSGISSGAIAGIIVGVIGGIAILVILVLILELLVIYTFYQPPVKFNG